MHTIAAHAPSRGDDNRLLRVLALPAIVPILGMYRVSIGIPSGFFFFQSSLILFPMYHPLDARRSMQFRYN